MYTGASGKVITMEQNLKQQIKRIEDQEFRFLSQSGNTLLQNTLSPVMNKLQDKIPGKLQDTLNNAFYKGFQLVFEKGIPYIEKTYNKDKIELEFDINNYALDKRVNKKHIKKLDRHSKQAKLVNSSFSVLEGSILGLFGIGLPDIPLFLTVLMKTVYETALSYGFSYDTPEEKSYIMLLISAAISKGEQQIQLDKELELLADHIDGGALVSTDLEQQMKATSGMLSEALLTAKFLQGIPVAGAIGGIVNYSIVSRVSTYAGLKYKKRYLMKKVSE